MLAFARVMVGRYRFAISERVNERRGFRLRKILSVHTPPRVLSGLSILAQLEAGMDIDGPLTEEELDELDQFLMSHETPDDCMDISMLDGFLTALAIGPNTLAPSAWMPVIWGGEMTWTSRERLDRISSLIFRHANAVLFFLRDDPDSFDPLLYEEREGDKVVQIPEEWCSGFVQGMALDEEAWQPLLDSDAGQELLFPILLFGTESGGHDLEEEPELQSQRPELVAALGESVLGIQAYWLPQRNARSTRRREEPKVGRNDLCPCGSGKKFKKCCGSPERLH
jgi:uncharacterized protein